MSYSFQVSALIEKLLEIGHCLHNFLILFQITFFS